MHATFSKWPFAHAIWLQDFAAKVLHIAPHEGTLSEASNILRYAKGHLEAADFATNATSDGRGWFTWHSEGNVTFSRLKLKPLPKTSVFRELGKIVFSRL